MRGGAGREARPTGVGAAARQQQAADPASRDKELPHSSELPPGGEQEEAGAVGGGQEGTGAASKENKAGMTCLSITHAWLLRWLRRCRCR